MEGKSDERMMRRWWGGIPKEAGRWKNWGRWGRGEKEGRGGIGEVNLGMIASDDELGLRRWSGRVAKNGMHPRQGVNPCISRVPSKAVI